MASSAKRKGTRNEYKTRDWLNKAIGKQVAKRVPGSGAFDGLDGDVTLNLSDYGYATPLKIEVKARKNPPKMFDRWLGNCDILFIWNDYTRSPAVYMSGETLDLFLELITTRKETDDAE